MGRSSRLARRFTTLSCLGERRLGSAGSRTSPLVLRVSRLSWTLISSAFLSHVTHRYNCGTGRAEGRRDRVRVRGSALQEIRKRVHRDDSEDRREVMLWPRWPICKLDYLIFCLHPKAPRVLSGSLVPTDSISFRLKVCLGIAIISSFAAPRRGPEISCPNILYVPGKWAVSTTRSCRPLWRRSRYYNQPLLAALFCDMSPVLRTFHSALSRFM